MIRVEHLVCCVQLVDKFQCRGIPIHVELEAHALERRPHEGRHLIADVVLDKRQQPEGGLVVHL